MRIVRNPTRGYVKPLKRNRQQEITRVRRATGIRCRLLKTRPPAVDTIAGEFGLQRTRSLKPVGRLAGAGVAG